MPGPLSGESADRRWFFIEARRQTGKFSLSPREKLPDETTRASTGATSSLGVAARQEPAIGSDVAESPCRPPSSSRGASRAASRPPVLPREDEDDTSAEQIRGRGQAGRRPGRLRELVCVAQVGSPFASGRGVIVRAIGQRPRLPEAHRMA
jgi:hypothetical protein